MKELIILGAGGHGRVVADVALADCSYQNISFLDDHPEKSKLSKLVIGKLMDYKKWIDTADFFVALGNSKLRQQFMEMLKKDHANIATLFHPSVIIGSGVELGEGTVIMPGAIINSGSVIGDGVIINTASSVDHDCVIGDYSHVAVGAHLAGTVEVGKHTWIGAGATVSNDVKITDGCMIGAGAVVVKNIMEAGTYVGVPARKMQ